MKNALVVLVFTGLLFLTTTTYYKLKSKNQFDFLQTTKLKNNSTIKETNKLPL